MGKASGVVGWREREREGASSPGQGRAIAAPRVGAGEGRAGDEAADISVDEAGVAQLHRDAVGLPAVFYFCLAGSAPMTAMLGNVPLIAGQAGAAGALVYLLSGIGILLLAVSIVAFARRLSAAGGFYTYVSHGLGPQPAFQAGWLMLGGYSLFETAILGAFGAFGAAALRYFFGLTVSWWALALLGGLLVFALSYFDLRRAVAVLAPLLVLEVAVLVILDLAITLKGGAAGNDLVHTFTPAGANLKGASPGGAGGIGIGMALGIWSWIGFESGAVYGEESRRPRRAIPVAIFGVVALLVALYCWTAYAATIGYGWRHAVDGLAADPSNAFYALADRYAAWLHPWMAVAIASSTLACALAFHNGMVRYFYAMGREGILPRVFGRTHPRYRSPHVAIAAQSAISLAMLLLSGVALRVPDGLLLFGDLGELGTYAFILVYILVNAAAVRYFWRRDGAGRNPLARLVAPALGTAVALIPLYSFVQPAPPYPLDLFPYIVAAWVATGVAVAAYLARRHPDRYRVLGRVVRLAD